MAEDLGFSCECGSVRGVVRRARPSEGDHVVCHCTDCQAFAEYCGAADRILDGNRGTALFQSRCARVELQDGRDRLACVHLTEKPTLRWYTTCCRTPMFNTYANGRVPYVTVVLENCDPARRAAALGSPIGHLFLDEATGDVGTLPALSMGRLMWRFFRRMLKDIVSGDRRRSVLFDPATLRPIATPVRVGGARSSKAVN